MGLVAAVRLQLLHAVALPVLGALGFCTRVPVGTSEPAWTAMTERPWAMVVAAYPLGLGIALPLLAPVSPATTALFLPVAIVALAGITHLDGLADVGDAAVVHGDAERRRAVLLDTEVGVGALVAVGIALLGLALAGLGLAGLAQSGVPIVAAAAVIVAAEVGAKLGMATLAGLGPATFGTLGSQLERAGPGTVGVAGLLAVPAVAASTALNGESTGLAAAGAVLAGPVAALTVGWWASGRLDGVNGDCFGATNELARLAGLHFGLALLGGGSADALAGPIPLAVLPVIG